MAKSKEDVRKQIEKNAKSKSFLKLFGDKVKDAPENIRVAVKDTIGGGVSRNDVERRIEMLERLLTVNKNDPAAAECLTQANRDLLVFRSNLEKKTTEWTPLYKQVGEATNKLQSDLEKLRNSEKKGRALLDNTDCSKTLASIEKLLSDGRMKAADRNSFQIEFANDKKLLIKIGNATGTDRVSFSTQLGDSATDLLDRIQRKVNTNNQQANLLVAEHKRLGDLLASVADDLVEQRVAISITLREANDLIGLCEFAEAKSKLAAAALNLKAVSPQPPGNKSQLRQRMVDLTGAWERYSAKLDQALKNPPNSGKPETKDVAELRRRAADLRVKWELDGKAIEFMLSESGTEAQVARMLGGAAKDRELAVKIIDTAASMISGRGREIPVELAGLIRGVEQKIQTLKISADDLYKNFEGDVQPDELLASLESVIGRWAKTQAKAVIQSDLLIEEYFRELDAIERAIKIKQDQIQAGTLTQDDIGFEEQIQAFRKAFEELTVSAERALAADYKDCVKKGISSQPAMKKMAADKLVSEHRKARENDVKVRARTLMLRGLVSEVSALKLLADKIQVVDSSLLEARRTQCNQLARELNGRVSVALQTANDRTFLGSANKESFRTYAATLLEEITLTLSPVRSMDMVVLNDVYTDLVVVGNRVSDFEKMVRGAKDAPKLFPDVEKLALELQGSLGHKRLVPRSEAMKEITDQVGDIVENYSKQDPRKSMEILTRLKTEIANAKLRAEEEHTDLINQIKVADMLVSAIDTQGVKNLGGLIDRKYGKYLENLKFRIAKFKDRVRLADRVDDKEKKVFESIDLEWKASIDVMLKNSLSNGETRKQRDEKEQFLTASVKSVNEEDEKIALAQERLERLRDVKLGVLKNVANGDDLNKEQKKNLKKDIALTGTAIKDGIENLKKNRDGDAANVFADSLEVRIDRMINSPMGNGTNSRNKIPEVVRQWKEAVRILAERIGQLREAVSSQCVSDAEIAAAAKLLPLQEELKKLFVAGAFDSVEKRLTDGSPSAKEIAAAKEEGLREVRRIEAVIAKHPKLKLLTEQANPFKEPKLPLAQLGAVLFNLKTNLMASG